MNNSRWQKEQTAIKAIQVAFDISADAQKVIKQEALANNLNPPDQIRKILGLSYNKKPVRPRLTVTLKDADFEVLGQRFTEQAGATGRVLADAATTIAASAAEMGSLGEGFGAAVEQFQGANAQLVQHLAALEERLSAAMNRSDEQLGYYVAQAREVIDLCLGSQKQVLDALQNTAATNG